MNLLSAGSEFSRQSSFPQTQTGSHRIRMAERARALAVVIGLRPFSLIAAPALSA